jgi:hypothetical protein
MVEVKGDLEEENAGNRLIFVHMSVTLLVTFVGGGESTMGVRGQFERRGKIGFIQSLTYLHPFSPHFHPKFFICPFSTQ